MTGRPYFLGVALIAIAIFWFAFQGAVRVEKSGAEYQDQLATALTFDTSIVFHFEKPIEVAEVVSGDTVRLINGEYVRYLGVDAPKTGKCYAEEMLARNTELVMGQYIMVFQDGDERAADGAWLGNVYLKDGTFVNDVLARELKAGLSRCR